MTIQPVLSYTDGRILSNIKILNTFCEHDLFSITNRSFMT